MSLRYVASVQHANRCCVVGGLDGLLTLVLELTKVSTIAKSEPGATLGGFWY